MPGVFSHHLRRDRSVTRAISLACLLWLAFAPAYAAEHKPPPVEPATNFAAVEVHPAEHLAIAVEPYNTTRQLKLFRVNYVTHGFMPVRLIVTNTGDNAISLKDARILFITAGGDRLQAAEPEDVERRIVRIHGSSVTGPIPGLHLPHKDMRKAIDEDFNTLEFQSLIVKPHTTEAGFLFYDVSGLSHPLAGAALNIHSLRDINGRELFYFEIPFDKYLASHSEQMN